MSTPSPSAAPEPGPATRALVRARAIQLSVLGLGALAVAALDVRSGWSPPMPAALPLGRQARLARPPRGHDRADDGGLAGPAPRMTASPGHGRRGYHCSPEMKVLHV